MLDRARVIDRWLNVEPLYLDDTAPRREYIAGQIAQYVAPGSSVLEIGCNAGSNLVALQRRGFCRLFGIDVSARAIEAARKRVDFAAFPGSLSEWFDHLKSAGPYDLVFSLAVLMHIHEDDDAVLHRIPELVGKYLITCEWEHTGGEYIAARDYGELFGGQLKQIHHESVASVENIDGYQLRVFEAAR